MPPLHPGRFARKPSFRTVIVLHRGDVLGGGLRSTRGNVRWLVAAGLALGVPDRVAGQAGADDRRRSDRRSDDSSTEGEHGRAQGQALGGRRRPTSTVDVATSEGSGYDRTGTSTVTIPARPDAKVDYDVHDGSGTRPRRARTSPFTVTLSNPCEQRIEIGGATDDWHDHGRRRHADARDQRRRRRSKRAPQRGVQVAITGKSAVDDHRELRRPRTGRRTAGQDYDAQERYTALRWSPGETSRSRSSCRSGRTRSTRPTRRSRSHSPVHRRHDRDSDRDDDDHRRRRRGRRRNRQRHHGRRGQTGNRRRRDHGHTFGREREDGNRPVRDRTAHRRPKASDYEQNVRQLRLQPGDTSETVIFKVKGDTLFEHGREVLGRPHRPGQRGRLDPTCAARSRSTTTTPRPTPTLSSPSVAEGNSGLTDLVFDVTLACPRPAVTFNYRTLAGTATASDFTEVGGSQLNFPACGAGPATN